MNHTDTYYMQISGMPSIILSGVKSPLFDDIAGIPLEMPPCLNPTMRQYYKMQLLRVKSWELLFGFSIGICSALLAFQFRFTNFFSDVLRWSIIIFNCFVVKFKSRVWNPSLVFHCFGIIFIPERFYSIFLDAGSHFFSSWKLLFFHTPWD